MLQWLEREKASRYGWQRLFYLQRLRLVCGAFGAGGSSLAFESAPPTAASYALPSR